MEETGQIVDWSRAYTQYRPDILHFLTRRVWGRVDLAEDLAQETFTRALNAGSPLRDHSRIRSYLLQIANNVFLSHVRRPSSVTSESDLGPDIDLGSHVDRHAVDPLEDSAMAELKEKLDSLMAELPQDQRTCFVGGVLERRTYAEVAELNGWTVEKVKSCVFRARRTLMPALKDYR